MSGQVAYECTSVSTRTTRYECSDHAIIAPHGSGYRVLDDRSLNGTFVNGSRVERADLHDRDVITLGHVDLVYLAR